MICVAAINGCGIGYKYYARYIDCQRKMRYCTVVPLGSVYYEHKIGIKYQDNCISRVDGLFDAFFLTFCLMYIHVS